MYKHKSINIKCVLLLLIYLISNFPLTLFHHHNHGIVAFNNANHCEKTIYYGEKNACTHKYHFSNLKEKCSFCSHHTISSHTNSLYHFSIYKPITFTNNKLYAISLYSTLTFKPFNKGPPIV